MASSIGRVAAVFTASTGGLRTGASEAGAALRKLGSDVSVLRSRMGTLAAIQGAQLFGSISAAAASAANSLTAMAQSQAEAIDVTSKLSRRLGMAYSELAGLKLAGDLAGVGMEEIGKAATKADVAFVRASQGSKLAKAAIEGVGLSVDDLQNKSPAQRFQMIADAIGRLPTAAERARAAVGLFGKSGAELLPLFEGTASGIQQGFNIAAVSARSLSNATQLIDQSLAAAAGGSQQATAAFAKIGMSVDELAAKRPEDRFRTVGEAIAKLPTLADRASAAVSIFGVSAASLLPAFGGASGAIAKATEQASMFGLALTDAQGQDVEAMNDSFTLAGAAIEGVVQQVTAYLAPAIQSVTDTFTTLIGGIGSANIGQFIGDGIIAGAEFLAATADAMISGLSGLWQYVASVGQMWTAVMEIGSRVAAALSGVFNVGKFVLGAAVLSLGMTVQGLATIGQQIGKFLGFDTSSIDSIVAGAKAFNDSVVAGMDDAASQAGADFKAVVEGASPKMPETPQAPGPFSTMVADAADKARQSRAAVPVAPTSVAAVAVSEPAQPPKPPSPSTEAIKSTDSRSKEGIAEMFRLMRGSGDQVQEQQLGVLEQIRDAVSWPDQQDIYTLAGS